MTGRVPSWTGDVELDRIELGDRVADAWADDLMLTHSRRLARAIDVSWFSVMPPSWLLAFGVRSLPNTERREESEETT